MVYKGRQKLKLRTEEIKISFGVSHVAEMNLNMYLALRLEVSVIDDR